MPLPSPLAREHHILELLLELLARIHQERLVPTADAAKDTQRTVTVESSVMSNKNQSA